MCDCRMLGTFGFCLANLSHESREYQRCQECFNFPWYFVHKWNCRWYQEIHMTCLMSWRLWPMHCSPSWVKTFCFSAKQRCEERLSQTFRTGKEMLRFWKNSNAKDMTFRTFQFLSQCRRRSVQGVMIYRALPLFFDHRGSPAPLIMSWVEIPRLVDSTFGSGVPLAWKYRSGAALLRSFSFLFHTIVANPETEDQKTKWLSIMMQTKHN